METRFFFFLLKPLKGFLAITLFTVSLQALGQEPIDLSSKSVIVPEVPRREIHEDQIDTEDFELSVFAGVLSVEDFGSNAVYGLRAAYHLTEDFFTELSYGQSKTEKTSYENLSGGVDLLTDDQRQFSYYNLSIGYNILPGEVFVGGNYAFNSALYVIAGVGSTRFADDDRFTINFGAGYRLLLTDSVAFHIDVRDHMFDIDLLGTDKTTHNIELTTGLSVFF